MNNIISGICPGGAGALGGGLYGQNAVVMSSWRSAYDGLQRAPPYGKKV